MTIRDVDCKDFDVEHMIESFKKRHVSLFSFFCGGYVTTYPTQLEWQRMSPWLEGRDLTGEIIRAAHANDMVAFPMMDLGEVPLDVAEANPGWAAEKADGSFFVKTDGIVTSCPLGGYVRECSKLLLGELLDRYGDEVDGIKFGGASYGFAPGVCHCANCTKTFREETGRDLPKGNDDPAFAEYKRWTEKKMKETVRYLVEVVHAKADIPVMGNSVWHLGRGNSIDDLARDQDFVQVEIQTRYFPTEDDSPAVWERFTFPTETTSYISQLSPRAPWVVASYFLAWPWRRVAVPWHEQKIFLAQVSANGGSPMVNLSGGPPKVHEDQRGFRAIEELYGFMDKHADLYEGDKSGATVAILSSNATAHWAARQEGSHEKYLADMHAIEDVLLRQHIPCDIWDVENLHDVDEGRYAALVLPNATVLTQKQAASIEALVKAGVGLVCDGAPGILDEKDAPYEKGLLDDLLGVTKRGDAREGLESPHQGKTQAYAKQADESHPLFEDLPCELFAYCGPWYPVEISADADAPLKRGPAFRLFPEGMSYSDHPDTEEPYALCREPDGGGRTVYFPFYVGKVAKRTGHPDYEKLIANAVNWVTKGNLPVKMEGRSDVLVTVRKQKTRTLVHLINTTGRERFLTEFTPVHDLVFSLKKDESMRKVYAASDGQALKFEEDRDEIKVTLPKLVDYDIIVFE